MLSTTGLMRLRIYCIRDHGIEADGQNVAAVKSRGNRNIHFYAQKESAYCHHFHDGARGNDNIVSLMTRLKPKKSTNLQSVGGNYSPYFLATGYSL